MIGIFVPSFRDVMLDHLFKSMEASENGSTFGIRVLENGLSGSFKVAWPQVHYIPVPSDPFVDSVAYNIAFASVPDDDVVIIHDDVEIMTPHWSRRIEQLFRYWPFDYGMMTFAESTTRATYGIMPPPLHPFELPTVALGSSLLIPRRVLNQVGPWDERLVGYGFNDFDYGMQCLHMGYRLGIAGDVILHTTAQATAWVARLGSYEAVLERQDQNARLFHEKWFGVVPANLRDIQRPITAEHFNRKACRCR